MVFYLLIAGQALCLLVLAVMVQQDYIRLTQPVCRVDALIDRYDTVSMNGSDDFVAVYRFASENAEHEVTDSFHRTWSEPPVGSTVTLTHPQGRPDLARESRPGLWGLVYAVVVGVEAALLAGSLGWFGG